MGEKDIERDAGLPIDRKFLLTVGEANVYFGIGETKIRQMLNKPGCTFVLHIGKKVLIKRQKMEQYLESRLEI